MSVYDEMPSPGAGLLRYARLKAGLSQSELGERAGVARTMVSAYEHDRRQATLPTLMRLLKAAGFELRMQLAPTTIMTTCFGNWSGIARQKSARQWEDYQRACCEGSRGRIGRLASPEDDQGAKVKNDRFDPLKIVQALNHRGVEYVVIGGYAGELHAAAVPRPAISTSRLAPRPRTSVVSHRHSPISTPGSVPRGYPTVSLSPTTLHHSPPLAYGTSPARSVSSTSTSSQAGQTATRTWCALP